MNQKLSIHYIFQSVLAENLDLNGVGSILGRILQTTTN